MLDVMKLNAIVESSSSVNCSSKPLNEVTNIDYIELYNNQLSAMLVNESVDVIDESDMVLLTESAIKNGIKRLGELFSKAAEFFKKIAKAIKEKIKEVYESVKNYIGNSAFGRIFDPNYSSFHGLTMKGYTMIGFTACYDKFVTSKSKIEASSSNFIRDKMEPILKNMHPKIFTFDFMDELKDLKELISTDDFKAEEKKDDPNDNSPMAKAKRNIRKGNVIDADYREVKNETANAYSPEQINSLREAMDEAAKSWEIDSAKVFSELVGIEWPGMNKDLYKPTDFFNFMLGEETELHYGNYRFKAKLLDEAYPNTDSLLRKLSGFSDNTNDLTIQCTKIADMFKSIGEPRDGVFTKGSVAAYDYINMKSQYFVHIMSNISQFSQACIKVIITSLRQDNNMRKLCLARLNENEKKMEKDPLYRAAKKAQEKKEAKEKEKANKK